MPKPFKGVVNIDVRDSVPDWEPYEQPKAKEGSPNVLYIVLDDVGFGALSCYGGPIETPNIDRVAKNGVSYTQWHTTALCSPTRSCLLTGRNHTMNGMACITEGATGFPSSNGHIPFENAMIPAVLGQQGYSTFMVGKWHLVAGDEMNLASAKDHWPLGRGFERYYGFLGAETNQWYPDITYDNHPAEQPASPEAGYHFTDDITDKALGFIQDLWAVAPEKPFFLYYCPGAAHAPHHAPKEWIEKYRGKFDMGYEAIREQTLERQKKIGIVPEDTQIPPVNPLGTATTRTGPDGKPFPEVDFTRPWESLSEDEKRLFCRMAEVYAGFLSHADYHVGRLLQYLEEMGQLENTLVVVVSDNGASGEGGPNGSVNECKFFNGIPDDLQANLAMLDDLGSPKTYNHYPTGWAMAFNTPFKMWKRYEFEGGCADPCIVSWPKGMKARGEVRHQYHHAIDIVPTVLEATGVEAPEVVNGYTQTPIQGTSMVYSFDDAKVPTKHTTQFYSMLGSRAIYHDGWKAITTHPTIAGWGNFGKDTWELYHTDVDRAELQNLADEFPEKLQEMIALWYSEAGANQAFPLDDRTPLEILLEPRPQLSKPRTRYVYFPGTSEVPEAQAVSVRNRSFAIGAVVDNPDGNAEGVIFAQGSHFGGQALYVKDKHLHYVNNFVGIVEQKVSSSEEIPTGSALILSAAFEKEGEEPRGVAYGTLSLYFADKKVGETKIKTQPGYFALTGDGLCVGWDSGAPVTEDYPGVMPWRFKGGTINRVAVDVSGEAYADLEREAVAMMARE